MIASLALAALWAVAAVRGDVRVAGDPAHRKTLLADLEALRVARRQIHDLYTAPPERGRTWVVPQLPHLPTAPEAILWAWILDREDVAALDIVLRDEIRRFNEVERTRRVDDSRGLLMSAQDLAVLIEQGRGTEDDDGWRAFGRESGRLASRFSAREEVFIRSLWEPLHLDPDRQQRLELVVQCRAIRRTYVDYVVMKPSDVDLVEVLVATDLAEPLVQLNAERFDAELSRALADLAALRRRWERQKIQSTSEHYSRVREARHQGTRAPIDALRRDVVAAEEAIITATLGATDALARQLEPQSAYRLRAAVHSRLFPEVHPVPHDLSLVLIELDADRATGDPSDDSDIALHARARRIIADGSVNQADVIRRMEEMVMSLRRAEGMQSIPLPALEAETIEELKPHARMLREHAREAVEEIDRLDARLSQLASITRLRETIRADELDGATEDPTTDVPTNAESTPRETH